MADHRPSSSTSVASPPLLLRALRLHLLPTPHLPNLPSALNIYAHFQLLSDRVRAEAREALRRNDALAAELQREQVPLDNWFEWGALSRNEVARLSRWAARDGDDKMFGFSLELRKAHVAKLLETSLMDPRAALGTIDTYFPPSSSSASSSSTANPGAHLFNQITAPDQRAVVKVYRQHVMQWYEAALHAHQRSRARPQLVPSPGGVDAKLETLGKKLVTEAESVLKHSEALAEMFAQPPTAGSPRTASTSRRKRREPSSGEAQLPLPLPLQDALDTIPTYDRPRSRASLGATRLDGSPGMSAAELQRAAAGDIALESERLTPVSTSRRIFFVPLSRAEQLRGDVQNTPIVSRGAASARTASTSTPEWRMEARAEHEIQDDVGNVSLDHGHQDEDGHTPSSRTADLRRPDGETPSPRPKKKHRPSLPPATGPDYTLPSPKLGANVPRSMMRPFDSTVLKRSRLSQGGRAEREWEQEQEQDENDPRSMIPRRKAQVRMSEPGHRTTEALRVQGSPTDVQRQEGEQVGAMDRQRKRASLANGESLSNSQSQSSGESLETKEKRRLAKGKWRADPEPAVTSRGVKIA